MPSKSVVMFHITREEYPLFLAGMKPDHRLPSAYDDWYKETVRQHKMHRAAALKTEPVIVHWDDFVSYCQRLGMKPTYAALNTFAITKDKTRKRTGPDRL